MNTISFFFYAVQWQSPKIRGHWRTTHDGGPRGVLLFTSLPALAAPAIALWLSGTITGDVSYKSRGMTRARERRVRACPSVFAQIVEISRWWITLESAFRPLERNL